MAKLYFYYSAMNAGKSTTLLQSNHNYQERGMNTLMLVPRLDDRYGEAKITSRIGLQADAIAFDRGRDLYVLVRSHHQQQKINCLLLDEAQFLSKAQVWQLTDICDQLNIPVLAYGIRTDFRGDLFEGSMHLLALAEELVEIKTVCFCGRKALMNARVDAQGQFVSEGDQVQIGHDYVSTCRKHFKLRQCKAGVKSVSAAVDIDQKA
jgi:thymidine kinase